MRKAIFVALLLVLGSAVLGATVLREPIAWAATTPFQNVIVANDKTAPVPVREQNLDAGGAIQVADQSAREAARYEGVAHSNLGNFQTVVPAVPAGKRFVISYINIWGGSGIDSTVLTGADCFLLRRSTKDNVTTTGAMVALPVSFSGVFAVSEQMNLPIEAGESIAVSCRIEPNPQSVFGSAVIVGNYVAA